MLRAELGETEILTNLRASPEVPSTYRSSDLQVSWIEDCLFPTGVNVSARCCLLVLCLVRPPLRLSVSLLSTQWMPR